VIDGGNPNRWVVGTVNSGEVVTISTDVTIVDNSGDLDLALTISTTNPETVTINNVVTKSLLDNPNYIRFSDLPVSTLDSIQLSANSFILEQDSVVAGTTDVNLDTFFNGGIDAGYTKVYTVDSVSSTFTVPGDVSIAGNTLTYSTANLNDFGSGDTHTHYWIKINCTITDGAGDTDVDYIAANTFTIYGYGVAFFP
jgi:hypothetical protein